MPVTLSFLGSEWLSSSQSEYTPLIGFSQGSIMPSNIMKHTTGDNYFGHFGWRIAKAPSALLFSLKIYQLLFLLSEPVYVREGCRGISSRLSRHTSRSATTSNNSLDWSPKRFHPIFSMYSAHRVHGRPTGLFPFTFASKAYLGSLSWGILLTWKLRPFNSEK